MMSFLICWIVLVKYFLRIWIRLHFFEKKNSDRAYKVVINSSERFFRRKCPLFELKLEAEEWEYWTSLLESQNRKNRNCETWHNLREICVIYKTVFAKIAKSQNRKFAKSDTNLRNVTIICETWHGWIEPDTCFFGFRTRLSVIQIWVSCIFSSL